MKKRLLATLALTLVLVISLSGCKVVGWFSELIGLENPYVTIELTDAPLNTQKLIDFQDGANPDVLFESDGWSNGDVFNVVWKKHNVIYDGGIMRLGITEEKATAWLNDEEVEFKYTAGEARTQNYYHYGDYEVSMKPSANGGTASTFFVCTGPYDLKNGTPNPHDEIDIEFLGKDTTKVQFNFFVDGKGGNEYMYDLGFDASQEFHTYGFRWAEDSITWFVDGKPVYKVTTDTSVTTAENVKQVEKLPSTAGRILTNYWCGNERAWGWMGQYKGSEKDSGTTYQWIATSAEGAPLNPSPTACEHVDTDGDAYCDKCGTPLPTGHPPVDDTDKEIDWTSIAPIAPTFASTPEYVVATDGNAANVTYTNVSGSAYKPIEMNIAEAAAGKNYVYLKVTNNGTELVNVRVNVVDQALVDAQAKNMSTNVSATMDGVAVKTDSEWGGSFFDLEAGQSAELIVKFTGEVELLQLMIDSSRNDSTLRSGDVTVADIKFATDGDTPVTPPACEDHRDTDGDAKCDNCGEELPVPPSIDDEGLQFDYWTSNASYFVIEGNNIQYNGAGNTYACFGSDISALAAGKTTFTVTVTNNGTSASRVRFDIQGTTQVGKHSVCNVTATGGDVWTDDEWGGSIVTVAAGESVTLVITYDENTERGAITNLVIFVDGMRGDSNVYSSNITLSGMSFS